MIILIYTFKVFPFLIDMLPFIYLSILVKQDITFIVSFHYKYFDSGVKSLQLIMPVKANISNVLEWKYFEDPEVDNFFVAEQIDMINKFGCIEINLMNKLYTTIIRE